MKRSLITLVLLIVSSESILRAQEEPEVLVRDPIIRFVRAADLPKNCGTGVRIEACTAFAGQRLTCDCEQRGEEWRIVARAQLIPVMYIVGAKHVVHEREHVDDIRSAVEQHVRSLSAVVFESAERCNAAAASHMAGFTSLMDEFKLASNAARHPGTVRTVASAH
ncbi:MAG: hypothetical protein ACYC7A_03370 [Thermoanaerobaculia bacterium]